MKTIIVICILALLSCQTTSQNTPTSEAELVKAFSAAFKAKDLKAVSELTNWTNIREPQKEKQLNHIHRLFDIYENPVFTTRPMTSLEKEPVTINGKTYKWNIIPLGFIIVKGNDPDYGSTEVPFCKEKGCCFIAVKYVEN
jgi:hypothetical protein